MELNSEKFRIFVTLFGNRRRHSEELTYFDPSENLQVRSARAISLNAVPPVVNLQVWADFSFLRAWVLQNLQTGSDNEARTFIIKLETYNCNDMQTFLVQTPATRGRMIKWYTFIVPSQYDNLPSAEEIKQAMISMGYTDTTTLSYCSPGNWKIKKMPKF